MKKLVFTFGRMNPPTIGHEKLANKIKAVAKQEKADARIYLSHTQNPTKDPLSYQQKLSFAKKAFGIAHKSSAKQIFQILKEVYEEGYTDIIMVVGSDRVNEFSTLLKKYNGKGDYDFDSINVVSAGQRDPDAKGVEGMSGTKLRAIAKAGDFDTFKQAAASKLSDRDKKRMMDMVQKALKEDLEEAEWTDEDTNLYEELEQLDLSEALTPQQRQKRARLMKRIAPKIARMRKIKAKRKAGGDVLQKRARKAAIQKTRERVAGEKGKKYSELSLSARQAIDKRVQKQAGIVNKLATKLLPSVKKKELERVKRARTNEDFDALVEDAVKTIKVGESSVGAKDTSYALVKERKILAIGLKDEMLKLAEKEGGRVWKVNAESQVGDLVENVSEKTYLRTHPRLKNLKVPVTRRSGRVSKPKEKIVRKEDKKKDEGDQEVRQDPDIKDRKGTQPAVYYSGDMKKSTKKKRAAAFAKQAKMADDDPKAYKPAPGDASAKTKPSKHTQKYKQMFGEEQLDEEIKGLKKKSEKSGIAYGILKKVYDRGMAAWKTGHRPGTTPQQWAFARVNSFITGGKTRTTADADLWAKHSGKKEEVQIDENVGKYEKIGGKTYYAVVNKAGKKKLFSGPTSAAKKYAKTNEAVSPAQQAAIAIAKKESGKYDKDGKRIKKEKYNPDDDFSGKPVKKFKDIKKKTRNEITEAIQYHLDTGVPFADNIFRHTSASFYKFFQEARVMHRNGDIEIDAVDKQILETDIGMFGIYEGKEVPLDCPLMEADKDVELNSPKRGGSKKFYVYVKNDKGNVIKVEFGDTTGLKAKINDRDAARSFAARHQCDTKTDKTKPGYWACRLPWYAKALGLEGGGKYFW